MPPLPVTAVIAAYNRQGTVDRAIRSVLMQTEQIAEILVVDDASSDGSAEVAEAAGVRVIRRATNGGAAAARNDGIRQATQPWIAFLDSDDEWLAHHIATLWPHTHSYALVTGASLVREPRPGIRYRRGLRRPRVLRSPASLVFPDNLVSSGGVLVLRQALLEVGGYDTTLRISEDFDLWLRVLARHRGLALPEPVCVYHVHSGQKTADADRARVAQRQLLERYRGERWWSEAAYARRLVLNECERRLRLGARGSMVRFVLGGLVRRPATYMPVCHQLLKRQLAQR